MKIAIELDIQIIPQSQRPQSRDNLYQNQNPENIKMNIDFTKLARIAHQNNRGKIPAFLIGYEQSIVKKIPFLLEINEWDQALKFAMDSGDPNIIEKVFFEILEKNKGKGGATQGVLDLVYGIDDCLRHLRNYAKKRKDFYLMEQIINYQLDRELKESQSKDKMVFRQN